MWRLLIHAPAGGVAAVRIFKPAVDQTHLFTAKVSGGVEACLWRPPNQRAGHALFHQRHHRQAGHEARVPFSRAWISDFFLSVTGTQTPALYKDSSVPCAVWRG